MISVTLLLSPMAVNRGVYAEAVREQLTDVAEVIGVISPASAWPAHREILERTEVILTSWGAPVMDEAFLSATPRLRAVFYAAGTVRYFITDAIWRREVRVFTARSINAIPTSEYAAAVILLSLKKFWHYARLTRERCTYPKELPQLGIYRRTVGLVSYGAVGRLVRQRLRLSGLNVLVYDPYVSLVEAEHEGVRLVSLDELFSEADVVSLHTPLLAETKNLITGAHFGRMRPHAVFINTARGAIVNEAEMIVAAQSRADLQLILDVTASEPPPADSPLYTLPNVVLTPHIAGSSGHECRRLGDAMVDELRRFVEGKPLQYELSSSSADWLA
jgi:phosphoglycerate dehydrogenase-like enzyme